MTGGSFIDLESAGRAKAGQAVSGDVFLSRKIKAEGRVISVLSDGMGSGVKAGVLASLTASMALRYTSAFADIRQSAGTIMDTLPVCETRKLSYSTFTILDLEDSGGVRIIEHGNPAAVLLRGSQPVPLERADLALEHWRDRTLGYSECRLAIGDRLVCFSDGVSQAGLGRPGMPLGWGREKAVNFLRREIDRDAGISAGELSRALVAEALLHDGGKAGDDITCAVVYFRHPRQLLVVTGPPFSRERDGELAERVARFEGRKAICGGTTAHIVSRLLNRPLRAARAGSNADLPPAAEMDGVDLITEGTLTLARVAEMLERGAGQPWPDSPARDLLRLMLGSDVIRFLVGTRVNEAHLDPGVTRQLDLRRNIAGRIAGLLESHHLKECSLQFL